MAGFKSQRDPIWLSRGPADFVHSLRAPTGVEFPAGFGARIDLYASNQIANGAAVPTPLASWLPDTVDETAVTWIVQSDSTGGPHDMITAGAAWYRLYVQFPASPTTDYEWYFGPVEING